MINLFAILLLANLPAGAQCDGALFGKVVDARSQKPLAKVRIEVVDQAKPVRTNEKGRIPIRWTLLRFGCALRCAVRI